jgi:hypothetical protein
MRTNRVETTTYCEETRQLGFERIKKKKNSNFSTLTYLEIDWG